MTILKKETNGWLDKACAEGNNVLHEPEEIRDLQKGVKIEFNGPKMGIKMQTWCCDLQNLKYPSFSFIPHGV